jgi:hypothetical protein
MGNRRAGKVVKIWGRLIAKAAHRLDGNVQRRMMAPIMLFAMGNIA